MDEKTTTEQTDRITGAYTSAYEQTAALVIERWHPRATDERDQFRAFVAPTNIHRVEVLMAERVGSLTWHPSILEALDECESLLAEKIERDRKEAQATCDRLRAAGAKR